MSLHSIIEHRANYYFLKLEEDYVEICQGKHKHCKAAILSILENWMNSKRATTSRESDLYVYLSYPQFVKQMFGLYERSTVITSLKELEQEGLILKRPFKDVFNQDTFEYRLNCPAVQQRLIMLPDKSSAQGSLNLNYPGVNLNDGSVETDEGSFENKRGGSVNLDDGSFKNKRNIEPNIDSNIEPTENTEREVADATARSQSSQEISLSEDTVKREAVKASQKEVVQNGHTHQHPIVDNHSPIGIHQPQPSQPEHRKEDTNKITEPPAPRKPRSNPTIPKRPRPQQQELTDTKISEISPEAVAIMDLWDEANNKKIPRTTRIIQGATLLVSCNPTAEKLKTCKGWLFTTDNPKKPWYRKIGVDLLDVANNWSKWESLGDTPQAKPPGDKEPSNEHKAAGFYSNGALFERNKAKTEAKIAEALAWDEARRAREVQS